MIFFDEQLLIQDLLLLQLLNQIVLLLLLLHRWQIQKILEWLLRIPFLGIFSLGRVLVLAQGLVLYSGKAVLLFITRLMLQLLLQLQFLGLNVLHIFLF